MCRLRSNPEPDKDASEDEENGAAMDILPDPELMVTFVYKHELTDGTPERDFPKELFDKVQEVKNQRKEIVLALDPNNAVGDIKDFLLEGLGMKSVSVEQNEELCLAQMIVMVDTKVVLDSDTIYDLIERGDLRQVSSPNGDQYILHYIFLRPVPALAPTQQQETIDALVKNRIDAVLGKFTRWTITRIKPPTASPSTVPPDPETHQIPVNSSPSLPDTEMETVTSESANTTSGVQGTQTEGIESNMEQSVVHLLEGLNMDQLQTLLSSFQLRGMQNGDGSVGGENGRVLRKVTVMVETEDGQKRTLTVEM